MKQTPSLIYYEQCSWYKRYALKLYKNMFRSVVTMAKVTLVFMNIWVLAVVLVVSLGHWRVFESTGPKMDYDNSHLIVMRELKEEASPPINLSRPAQLLFQPEELVPHVTQKPTTSTSPKPKALSPAGQRVANLRHWCQQQHPIKVKPEKIAGSKLSSILVDEKNKLLFCQVPSVGINEWRKIILITSGAVNMTDPKTISGGDVYGKYGKSIKRLNEYSDSQRGKMLKEFYKVIFVRDPLERLLTTFNTKITPKSSPYFHKAYGSQIIKKYRKGASADVIKKGDSVKFSEFAQYIVDMEFTGESPLNEHWRQYYKQCHPCLVEYDYVGKFESVTQDSNVVLDKLKVRSKIKKPVVFDTKIIPESELKKQYGSMSAHTLNNLFKVYSADFTLFGYKCPQYLHDLMEKGHVAHDY